VAAGARSTAALRDETRAQVLAAADVVACTLVGSGVDSLLSLRDSAPRRGASLAGAAGGVSGLFDAMIVDEATQACEPAVLVALQHVADVCVLVGDHRQLPPTIKSEAALAGGLGVSLFERLLACGMTAPRCVTEASTGRGRIAAGLTARRCRPCLRW
jgi:superfamily I DNA and/or RNA helicase